MPRRGREQSPTGIYHVMLRGVNRQSIFEEEEDKRKFLDTFVRYREKCGYKIFAYCLMDNHVHLLMQEQTEPLSIAVKRITSSYVFWFNKKYERCGHLFQERYKSEVVDSEKYFLAVLRYIHQNPMKAKIVKNLSSYKWSSYREYIGQGLIVDKGQVLNMFSNSPDEALRRFEGFSSEETREVCLDVEEVQAALSDELLIEKIRELFGIDAIRISNEESGKQQAILRKLKQLEGVSVRQIERATGLPRMKIWRA